MIFDLKTIIESLSLGMTLEPGDVIATGTPAGVGPLQAGDRVEIRIDGVGTLKNPVVKL
jgi:2-keto-4-pentenoate hydratase/2-oxohepta-3-ene-1,7-dioic acid hydratase in catechol pathway